MAYQHRITMIMPANRITAFNAWYKANIVSDDAGDAVAVGLNGSGDSSPPTHYWCSIALDDVEGNKLIDRLVSQAQISKPANWNSLTRNQKKAWLNSQRATVASRIGVRLLYTNNDDKLWDNVEDLLAEAGLHRIGEMTPNG